MGKRGPISIADQSTAPSVELVQRPPAPLDLTPEQGDVWVDVVSSMPADWFSIENFPLLSQYCRHVVEARRIAQLIDEECVREEMNMATYAELLKMQRQESAALKTLAASMRLAQQSKYNAQSAATADKSAKKRKRPWD